MSAVVAPASGAITRAWSWIKGPPIAPEKRWTPTFVINFTCITAIVMIIGIQLLLGSWRLGLNFQPIKCLEGTGFLIHRSAPDPVVRGTMYAFESHGLMPLLRDGSVIVKIAAALPGDVVDVNARGIYINGEFWGPLNPIVLAKTHHTVASVTRHFVVGSDEVLMLGDQPRTYDGRYWGPVKRFRLVGHAWRLW